MNAVAASKVAGLAATIVAVVVLVVAGSNLSPWAMAPAVAIAGGLCGLGSVARGLHFNRIAYLLAALAGLLAAAGCVASLSAIDPQLTDRFFGDVDGLALLVYALVLGLAASIPLSADAAARPGLANLGLGLGCSALVVGLVGLLRAGLQVVGFAYWDASPGLGPVSSLLLLLLGWACVLDARGATWHLPHARGAGLPAFFSGLAGALALFLLFSQHQDAANLEYAQTRAIEGVDAVNRRIDVTENALMRIAMLMSEQREVEPHEWAAAVDSSRNDLPGLVQCDIESYGRRSYSPPQGPFVRAADAAWQQVFQTGVPARRVDSGFVRAGGDALLYFATFANGSVGHHVRIVALFQPAAFMAATLPQRTAQQYTCRLLSGGEVLYASTDLGGSAPWGRFPLGPVSGWSLHLRPSPQFLDSHRDALPLTVLLAGIACACLLGFSAHQATQSRRRAMDLRRTNGELEDSRSNLEQLVASLPEAVLVVAADGRIEKVGGAQLAVLAPQGSSLVGRNVDEIIGLDDGGVKLRTTRKVSGMDSLVGQKIDAVIHGDGGQTIFSVIRISALETPKGRSYLWTIADIQWRKAAEEERNRLDMELKKQLEAHRELAARHNALIHCGAIGMGLVDPQGRFLEFNETFVQTVGYSRDELLHMSLKDLNHPDDQGEAAGFVAEMQQGTREGYHVLKRYVRKDGTAVWVDVTGAAMRGPQGELRGVIGIMLDVSARIAATQALEASEQKLRALNEQLESRNLELKAILQESRENEERFRVLLASAPEATILVDSDGRILEFNKRAQELLGYTEAEARAGTVEMLVPPEVRPRHEGIRREFMAAPENRMMARGRDLVAICKDGTRVPVEINLSPLRFRGQVLVAASLVDLRERLRAAEELRASERRLREANKELESIVYVASHDMRSPLVNLQGFSRQLSAAAEKLGPLLAHLPPQYQPMAEAALGQEIPEAVGFISSSTRKMDGLIKGLLRLSRLGRAPLQMRVLDMNRLVAETVRATQFVLNERGITVEVGDLPPCWGDETQIGQVFSNLLDNAVKYRDPARPALVQIGGAVSGEFAVYTVQDNGLGIAPDHQKQVFEIFHRLSPDGPVAGEGLGLSVVRRVLDRHDGDVRLTSQPGVGSRFAVTLPRFAGARRPPEEPRD